ncbi:dsDNA nuclease domain-containing protein [Lentzea sp. HUAS12]|uniref:dsDNA nuclease domain-containing protein n=1 Tax=Lentzea sp. HUAS12 TaxID=2951806 RepID=UPI00209D8D21|nr:dsDNA nuclease domain-containing protein [Lentzea sp. HUAS12]USX55633.1 dsDNA nuclease domain-containing protein [Lentzea sp. HUAS12]
MGRIEDWPEEDAGSPTADRYAFQYHVAARHCCELLRVNGPEWVLCEWHTDYVIRHDGRSVLVSVKHRDDAGWRWTLARLFDSDALLTLRQRWEDCDRPAECRLVTNAGLDDGAKKLKLACRRQDEAAIRELASTISGLTATELSRWTDFLRVLRIEDDLPDRRYIQASNIERYMMPALDALGRTDLSPQAAYGAVFAEVFEAARDIADPRDNGWLLSAAGALDDDALRKASLARRKITKARLSRVLDEIHPRSRRPRIWQLPFHAPTVDRADLLPDLIELLLDSANPLAVVSGLHGAGGFGKTVLAHQACNRPEVSAHYDTLLWKTVGEEASGAALAAQLNDLVEQLSGTRPDFSDPQQAGFSLGRALEEHGGRVLLVLDDVWHRRQLAPFLTGGANCKRLVTTRNPFVVPQASRALVVDRMRPQDAQAVISQAVQGVPEEEMSRLLELTGRWPVLLGIAGRSLHHMARYGAPLRDAARRLIDQLEEDGPAALDLDNQADRADAVRATARAGLNLLPDGGPDRYAELALFGEDEYIPMDTVALLWQRTAGLDRRATERLCARLSDLSLVTDYQPIPGSLRLHDVLRSFLIQENGPERMTALHGVLLDSMTGPWWSIASDYIRRNLATHLRSAGRTDELHALLCEPRWLLSRIEKDGVAAAEADLTHADDPLLERLGRLLRQSAHLLHPTNPPGALGAIMASRLQTDPELKPLAVSFESTLSAPYLSNHEPLPDVPDPHLQRTLFGHVEGVGGLTSADGGRLLISLEGGSHLIVWDVQTGTLLRTTEKDEKQQMHIMELLAPADGSWVATVESPYGSVGRVRTWDVKTGGLRHEFTGIAALKPVGRLSAAVSSDGSRLAVVAVDDEDYLVVDVFDATTGELVSTFNECGQVRHLALSPDGRQLLIGGEPEARSEGNSVLLVDCDSGEMEREFHGPVGGITAVAFSPSGARVYAADACGDVWVWSAQGDLLHQLPCQHRWVSSLMAPDESWLATSDEAGVVRIWDLANGQQRTEWVGPRGQKPMAVSPDSRWLAFGDGLDEMRPELPRVTIIDASTGCLHRIFHGHIERVGALVFAADGSWLASGEGLSGPWRPEGDKLVRVWSIPAASQDLALPEQQSTMSNFVSAHGSRFIFDLDKIELWDDETNSGRLVTRTPQPWEVRGSLLQDTVLLATPVVNFERLLDRHPLHAVDVQTGEARFSIPAGHLGIRHVVVSPDETWFATTDGGSSRDQASVTRIWESETGTLRNWLEGEGIGAVAVSPDGSFLVVGEAPIDPAPCRAQIWCPETGEVVAVLPGHEGRVRSICIDRSGNWVATGDDVGEVRIWEMPTGKPLRSLPGSADTVDIQQSPDGRYLAVCEGSVGSGTLRVFDLSAGMALAEMRVDGALYSCEWSSDSRLLQASGARGDYAFAWHSP